MTIRTHIELECEATFHVTPGESGLRDSLGAPETPDREPNAALEAITCVDEAVCAKAPGWSKAIPERLGWYFFRYGKGATTEIAKLEKDGFWFDGMRIPPCDLKEMIEEGAQFCPILFPNQSIPVTINPDKLPKATVQAWEVQALRKNTNL